MNIAQRLWTIGAGDRPPESAAGPHDARDWQERDEGQNSNELAAQAVASIAGYHLTDRQRAMAAPVRRPLEMHLQSLAARFVYGVVAERVRRVAAASA